MKYTIQVAPEDCTGCTLCVMVCPAKDKSNPKHKAIDMAPQRPLRESRARELRVLPGSARPTAIACGSLDVKGSQFLEPLFEYSGACAAAARRRTSS
jgi:pyruvate-ferredoxin/flavodoxin oxidoreductase